METVNLTFNPNNLKLRLIEGRRMKIHIDFKQEEAQAYQNFEKMFKPDEISNVQFAKAIFLAGISAMQKEVIKAAQEASDSMNKQDQPDEQEIVQEEVDNDLRVN